MQVIKDGKYLRVLPPSDAEASKLRHELLGWRQRKGDPWIIAENNLVNRWVLHGGLDSIYSGIVACDDIDERLKAYQAEDVRLMVRLKHALNANPMGLGKTVEAIELLKRAAARSVLIVTPKIIRYQWVDQIQRWWGRDAQVFEKQPSLEPGNIYIVNYDKLRNEKTLSKFKRFRWDFVVLDEAHKIKNRTSKQTLAVKQIPCARRLALTGTPILRYADDLWSILNFLGEEYSGKSYWSFVEYFCQVEQTPWGNKIVGTTDDPFRQEMLRVLLSLFMIRRDVEVAQGKVVETIRLPMTKAQRDLYRKEKQLLLDQLPENCTIANGAVLTTRLRQTTSWPGLFLEKESGPKFEWILETCENNPNEKFVVFTSFAQTANALEFFLFEHKIGATKITGQQKGSTNEYNKRSFLTRPEIQVLIGTIGAMGQGYDELQNVSKIAIFIDRDWSPEINNQAEERLHRMGQKHLVQIYYLECRGSFDQHVGRINANKSEGIRRALESDDD